MLAIRSRPHPRAPANALTAPRGIQDTPHASSTSQPSHQLGRNAFASEAVFNTSREERSTVTSLADSVASIQINAHAPSTLPSQDDTPPLDKFTLRVMASALGVDQGDKLLITDTSERMCDIMIINATVMNAHEVLHNQFIAIKDGVIHSVGTMDWTVPMRVPRRPDSLMLKAPM